jgi:hypothetical protein
LEEEMVEDWQVVEQTVCHRETFLKMEAKQPTEAEIHELEAAEN